jgi:hypothetical protein
MEIEHVCSPAGEHRVEASSAYETEPTPWREDRRTVVAQIADRMNLGAPFCFL